MNEIESAHNKGEWSELYAFFRLLREGRIYAADENVERIEDVYLPIIKIIREEVANEVMDYRIGNTIRIYKNNEFLDEMDLPTIASCSELFFQRIFAGSENKEGTFRILEVQDFLERMKIRKVKAASTKKVDITMQVHDINTGYSPVVGFSIKSDLGSAPTLLNAGKNTRLRYLVQGLSRQQLLEINAIDKTVVREYMKQRIAVLFSTAQDIAFDRVRDEVFNDNLIMLDSLLPQILGAMCLLSYREGETSCEKLVEKLTELNPMGYHRKDIYRYKIKKLLSAAALGMTPGKPWNGLDDANGGYIIVKRDGDVLCYYLYNRNYFEEYLIKNTCLDRPSYSKSDYGYLYEENDKMYLDLNIQVRFIKR